MTGRKHRTGKAQLVVIDDRFDGLALSARWPEPVLLLSEDERATRVREGKETILYDSTGDQTRLRGFVRAVLKVPIGHPKASTYSVFVEVNREAYRTLQAAHRSRVPARVWGQLATRLPYLEEALGSEVEVLEDGSDLRPRVISAKSALLLEGPAIGAPALASRTAPG